MSTGSSRHRFVHSGRTIYEWEQTLEEVTIDIPLPPGAAKKDLAVKVTNDHLTVGLKGLPPYLDADFPAKVKSDESYWTVEEGTLSLQLCKIVKADFWASALVGHELAPAEQTADREQLMRERFQEEHPGFDFRDASFEGEVPDARTFMGGISRP